MTQPPESTALAALFPALQASVTTIQNGLTRLERTVQGDPDMGTPSLRQAVRAVADELQSETESLCDRLDKVEQAARQQEAYQRGVLAVVKWLGGGTLAALLGLILTIMRLFGGGS